MHVAFAPRMKPHAHVLAPLALLLPACTVHVEGGHHHSGPPVYDELEPNDSAYSAPFFGGLRPGDAFTIAGHVTDDGPDLYDGFAVRADEPCAIVFDLVSRTSFTDLDACVFDPDLGEFVVCSDGPFDPEHGSVVILEPGKVVHLVVTSAHGDTGYDLHVSAEPVVVHALAARSPGDPAKASERAGYAAPAPEPRPRRVPLVLYDLATGERMPATGARTGDELHRVEPSTEER